MHSNYNDNNFAYIRRAVLALIVLSWKEIQIRITQQ